MKLMAVDKLVPGLIVSENIYTIDDRLVLAKGTVLDEKDILRIKSHSLYNIFVEDDKPFLGIFAISLSRMLFFPQKFTYLALAYHPYVSKNCFPEKPLLAD